jgi:hypothetical protein
MPDFGAPIAQNVDVSPNKGLQTLSDLMGLQQKQVGIQQAQQTLQTGQALQQTAQAEAQKNQQAMGERQLLQSSMAKGADPDGNPLIGSNGEADPVALSKFANKYLPLTGQDVVQHIVTTQDNRLKLADTNRKLGQNYKDDLAGIVRSSMGDQNTPADAPGVIQSKIDAYVQQQGPNAPAALTNAASYSKSLLQNLSGPVPDAKAKLALLHLAQQFEPTAATAAAQQPSMGSVTGPSGGMQPVQNNPLSPLSMGATGPEVKQGVPPQIVTPPGGVQQVFQGGRGPVPTSYGPGPTPTQSDVENFGKYSAGLDNRVQVASDLIPRAQAAEQALAQIRAGGGAPARANFAKLLQSIPGMPQSLVDKVAGGSLADAQEAEKYLFQTTFAGLKQSMQGDPARVAEFNSAEQVFPTIGTDPKATASVLKFMTDQGQRDFAEQQALNKARTAGTFNPVTWQADYQKSLRAAQVPGVPASQVPGTAAAAPAKTPTGAGKTVTQANVQAFARAHGLSITDATNHVKASGYKIQQEGPDF